MLRHVIVACWSVLIHDVKEISKGANDDEHQEVEHFEISYGCTDQVDVVCWRFKQAHPVEDLDPLEKCNNAPKCPQVFFHQDHLIMELTKVDRDYVSTSQC